MAEETDAAQWYYAEIMRQLMESERFTNWFQCNFDVHKMINEEEKTIEIMVLEVHPAHVEERTMKMMAEKMREAQQQGPSLVTATAADMKALGLKGK